MSSVPRDPGLLPGGRRRVASRLVNGSAGAGGGANIVEGDVASAFVPFAGQIGVVVRDLKEQVDTSKYFKKRFGGILTCSRFSGLIKLQYSKLENATGLSTCDIEDLWQPEEHARYPLPLSPSLVTCLTDIVPPFVEYVGVGEQNITAWRALVKHVFKLCSDGVSDSTTLHPIWANNIITPDERFNAFKTACETIASTLPYERVPNKWTLSGLNDDKKKAWQRGMQDTICLLQDLNGFLSLDSSARDDEKLPAFTNVFGDAHQKKGLQVDVVARRVTTMKNGWVVPPVVADAMVRAATVLSKSADFDVLNTYYLTVLDELARARPSTLQHKAKLSRLDVSLLVAWQLTLPQRAASTTYGYVAAVRDAAEPGGAGRPSLVLIPPTFFALLVVDKGPEMPTDAGLFDSMGFPLPDACGKLLDRKWYVTLTGAQVTKQWVQALTDSVRHGDLPDDARFVPVTSMPDVLGILLSKVEEKTWNTDVLRGNKNMYYVVCNAAIELLFGVDPQLPNRDVILGLAHIVDPRPFRAPDDYAVVNRTRVHEAAKLRAEFESLCRKLGLSPPSRAGGNQITTDMFTVWKGKIDNLLAQVSGFDASKSSFYRPTLQETVDLGECLPAAGLP